MKSLHAVLIIGIISAKKVKVVSQILISVKDC